MTAKLTALLIGLGGIGCKYDYPPTTDAPFSIAENSKSHLGAILRSGIKLIGGIDTDENSREQFEKFTSSPTWNSLENFPKEQVADLVIISSSTSSHREIFQDVVNRFKPKGIVVEKPFGSNASDSKCMLELANNRGIPVRVNYSRNFSQGFNLIQEVIQNDKLVSGNVFYSQELRRNGSHFIRLVLELFGSPLSVIKQTTKVQDMNPTFKLIFTNGTAIQFTGSNSRHVRDGDLSLETENYLIQIHEGTHYRISLLNRQANPVPWPSQLDLLSTGNLNGGLQNIYTNLNWIKQEYYDNQIEMNFLDNVCNEILDELLSQ